MTYLVDDDVVGKMLRKKCDFTVEIQIPISRATPPPCFLILNTDAFVFEFVNLAEVFYALLRKSKCFLFMFQILRTAVFKKCFAFKLFEVFDLRKEPTTLLLYKPTNPLLPYPIGRRHDDCSINMNRQSHTPRPLTPPERIANRSVL